MGIWLIVLLAVIVLGAIGAVVSYNRFISQKTLIKDAWANIDTELRRRYDLIPNLVETVKGYACLLYTSPSPRDISGSRMPTSA